MDTGAALCEYELERDRRISRNLEVLRGLGLAIGASDGLHTKLSSYTLPQAAPPLKRPKLHKLVEEPEAPSRVSKRIRGDAPLTAEEIRVIVEREEQEGVGKSTSRQSAVLCLDGMAACAPFTLRSIGVLLPGTTVWNLGEIYRGPWAHRYWSNTGCLHHHAYPVGYKASKVQFGRTYIMEISAGPKGPTFSVTEECTGRTFSGASPTSPWTEVCLNHRTGQRISGPLYFGFSDPVTIRAIASLYNPEELQAAQQGQRVQSSQLTPAETAAREFTNIEGVGEAVAMALAITNALGGSPHTSLASLKLWAATGDNCRILQRFLLESEELPAATQKWPAWKQRIVPRILRAVCGDSAAEAMYPAPSQDAECRSQQKDGSTAPCADVTGQDAAEANRMPQPQKSGSKGGSSSEKENLRAPAPAKPKGVVAAESNGACSPSVQRLSRHRKSSAKLKDYVL